MCCLCVSGCLRWAWRFQGVSMLQHTPVPRSFSGWTVVRCVGRPHLVFPFISWWTLWLLSPFHCRECRLGIFQECKGAPVVSSHLFIQELVTAPFFFFFLAACKKILVPQSEIKPAAPALEVLSLNHWSPREIPGVWSILNISFMPSFSYQYSYHFFSLFYKISLSYAILPRNKDVNNVTKLLLFSFLITDWFHE